LRTGPTVCVSVATACASFTCPRILRLADDERVEAGGDAKEMPRGVEIDERIEVRRHLRGRTRD